MVLFQLDMSNVSLPTEWPKNMSLSFDADQARIATLKEIARKRVCDGDQERQDEDDRRLQRHL